MLVSQVLCTSFSSLSAPNTGVVELVALRCVLRLRGEEKMEVAQRALGNGGRYYYPEACTLGFSSYFSFSFVFWLVYLFGDRSERERLHVLYDFQALLFRGLALMKTSRFSLLILSTTYHFYGL